MRWAAGVLGIVIAVLAWRFSPLVDDDGDERACPRWQRGLAYLAVGLFWGCWMYVLQGDVLYLVVGPLLLGPSFWVLHTAVRWLRRRADRRAPTIW